MESLFKKFAGILDINKKVETPIIYHNFDCIGNEGVTKFFYKGYSIEQNNYTFFINGIQTTFGTLQHCKEYIDKQTK